MINRQEILNLSSVINNGLLLSQNKELNESVFVQWFENSRLILRFSLDNPHIYSIIDKNYMEIFKTMEKSNVEITIPKKIEYCIKYLQDIMEEL